MTDDPGFSGVISDIGGPTANMYRMYCRRPEIEKICRRLSCVHPTICKLLNTGHDELIDLMKTARKQKGVRKVFVASGIRMDLAERSPEYVSELARHHVGGQLSVAPEHTDDRTLNAMKKPRRDSFERFAAMFGEESEKAGKKQFLVPYFIASHPGSDLRAMIDLAVYLKQAGYKPDQVQDFIPAPMDIATCMYYTGIDPMSRKPVPVARHLRDRRLHRALLQFFKPENYFHVRDALLKAGRKDLIGYGRDALIPPKPPAAATAHDSRKGKLWSRGTKRPPKSGAVERAKPKSTQGDQPYDRSDKPRTGRGYRPHRKSARRRSKP